MWFTLQRGWKCWTVSGWMRYKSGFSLLNADKLQCWPLFWEIWVPPKRWSSCMSGKMSASLSTEMEWGCSCRNRLEKQGSGSSSWALCLGRKAKYWLAFSCMYRTEMGNLRTSMLKKVLQRALATLNVIAYQLGQMWLLTRYDGLSPSYLLVFCS